MAGITTSMSTTFKVELMQKLHDFTNTTGNTFTMALFKATTLLIGTYDTTTSNYSNMTGNSDELPGVGGYVTGGTILVNVTPTSSGTQAWTNFAPNPQWTSATFITAGCMIYNATNGNRSVGVFSFGGNQQVTNGTFTVQMPVAGAGTAVIQIN